MKTEKNSVLIPYPSVLIRKIPFQSVFPNLPPVSYATSRPFKNEKGEPEGSPRSITLYTDWNQSTTRAAFPEAPTEAVPEDVALPAVPMLAIVFTYQPCFEPLPSQFPSAVPMLDPT